jgi:hypothetical protein
LTFSLDAGAPSGCVINSSNGVFGWIPSEAQGPGSYPVTVRVTDNGSPNLSDIETFTITVSEVNNAPTLAPIVNRTVNEGSLLIVTNTASEPDNEPQTLTFSLDGVAPSGMTINPTNGVLRWTPDETYGPGNHSVTVRVTDNGEPPMSDTKTLSIFVNEVNTAPMLAPLASRTNEQGSLVTFTAAASDADIPANQLTFDLDPGAPPDASIDATNGLFFWTPASPGTNVITVRVTDDGTPMLSAARTFTVVVTSAVRISIQVSSSEVTLNWSAVAGRTYQVQYKNDLNAAAWTDLGGPITASGTSATATDTPGTGLQRFYRVFRSD